jgi:ATP-binding cassette subfamily B protein
MPNRRLLAVPGHLFHIIFSNTPLKMHYKIRQVCYTTLYYKEKSMLFGRRINKYYKKYLFAYIVGILFLLLVDYIQLLLPEQIGKIVGGLPEIVDGEFVAGTLTPETLLNSVLVMLGIGASVAVGRVIWRFCLVGTARKIEVDLKNEMFDHAQQLSQDFHSTHKVGALMSLFTADVEAVRMSLGFGVIMFIDSTFLGALAIYKMFMENWLLAIFALIPMLVIGIGGIWFAKSFEKTFELLQKKQENLSDFTQENFTGIAVIKAFVKQRREIKEFAKYNDDVYTTAMEFIRKNAMLETLIETLIGVSVVLIFAFGGYLASIGNMNTEGLVTFYTLFGYTIWPMIALAQIINMLSQGKASLNRLTAFLDAPVNVKDSDDVVPLTHKLTGAVSFRDLSFHYPDSSLSVLHNVSFDIAAGEMVGIVGRTGSGKSTLAEILLRTYNVDQNSLFVDGIDVMTIPLKDYRGEIGYVPQSNFLYSDTIHNNIAFGLGEGDATEDSVEEVARLSAIDSNIMEFPDGYDTLVGERGSTLSGGQKQRISIARALIKDPAILVLDDSVSAVDTATEKSIMTNLRKIRKGKTTVVIGHRISTMQYVDKIVLMDEGGVSDVGSHNELVQRSTLYNEMVKAQELERE